ncbi:MAG: hypothetical protein Q4C47_08555, partial [Planctomycetia bacterium]|nr:hypothetical protein [Planctomycetia bacterium]
PVGGACSEAFHGRILNLMNYIGVNETGFHGTEDGYYRIEGWNFMLAGSAIFNNLDHSFTVENPQGKESVVNPDPGGGGTSFRRQVRYLRDFFRETDLYMCHPIDRGFRIPVAVSFRIREERMRRISITRRT